MSKKPDFDVALSFAGENRAYVDRVANRLIQSGIKVFYDKFEQVDLWGKDLYVHLSEIYQERARYTVMFISKNYGEKLWTNHERKAAQARAFRAAQEYILPARFDDTEIPGVLSTIGYISLVDLAPEEFASIIIRKVMSVDGQPEFPDDRHDSAAPSFPRSRSDSVERRANRYMPTLRRAPSDLERRQFTKSAFETIRSGFDSRLRQLCRKHRDVETELVPVDATVFTAEIFVNGERRAQCKIWQGVMHSGEGISYAEGSNVLSLNACNEMLIVVPDGELVLRAMMNMGIGGADKGLNVDSLAPEDAAEYLWRRFTWAL